MAEMWGEVSKSNKFYIELTICYPNLDIFRMKENNYSRNTCINQEFPGQTGTYGRPCIWQEKVWVEVRELRLEDGISHRV
jgi:hypothetical protein